MNEEGGAQDCLAKEKNRDFFRDVTETSPSDHPLPSNPNELKRGYHVTTIAKQLS